MVDGVAQLTRNLTKVIPARVKQAARTAMEQGAEETVAMMKRLVPVDTGALRDSIGWTWGNAPAGSMVIGTIQSRQYNTMRIVIYAAGTPDTHRRQSRSSGPRSRDRSRSGYFDTDLARLQEFGTHDMPAQPFFFVSWRVMKKRVRSRITRNIRAAIKAEGGQ
jgi:HK97 gp10 family phage protein